MNFCPDWLLYWSAESSARRARTSAQKALRILHDSQREITANIESKRRRIRDFDRNILEIGLRWRKEKHKQLPATERSALANEMRRKRLYQLRIDRFYGLLTTLEENIAMLEDSLTLQTSIAAMRSGATAHKAVHMPIAEVESILERVSEQQALAADSSQLIADKAAASEYMNVTEASLEEELEHLMEDNDFIRQFDANDVIAAMRGAPDAPNADPLMQATSNEASKTMNALLLVPDLL